MCLKIVVLRIAILEFEILLLQHFQIVYIAISFSNLWPCDQNIGPKSGQRLTKKYTGSMFKNQFLNHFINSTISEITI